MQIRLGAAHICQEQLKRHTPQEEISKRTLCETDCERMSCITLRCFEHHSPESTETGLADYRPEELFSLFKQARKSVNRAHHDV